MRLLEYFNSIYAKCGAIILALLIYFCIPAVKEFADTSLTFLRHRDFSGLKNFILAHGIWAPLASVAVMALQSVVPLVPGLIITITNAWIFGWQYGAFYSWAGALLGALLDFLLARWYGRPLIEKIVRKKYLDPIDIFLNRHGILAIFITRLTPIVPFKIISYASGLTRVAPFQFAAATALAQTPAIILYSILGQNLRYHTNAVLGVTLFLMAIAAGAFCYRHKLQQYLDKIEI